MTLRYNSPRQGLGQAGQASLVLIGDSESKNSFIANFIKDEDIPGYNLFDYQEALKIPQAREIKKVLEKDALAGKKRLFIIRDITLEAQSALLKTLEELPMDTTFIFKEDFNLIPTILSRSRIVNFEKRKVEKDTDITSLVRNFIDRPYSPLMFSEELFSKKEELDFMNFIVSLREILLENLEKNELRKSNFILKLLKSSYKYAPLVLGNNLNKRVLLEKILMQEIH